MFAASFFFNVARGLHVALAGRETNETWQLAGRTNFLPPGYRPRLWCVGLDSIHSSMHRGMLRLGFVGKLRSLGLDFVFTSDVPTPQQLGTV